MTRRLSWLALAVVLAVALAVGSRSGTGPATPEARVERIASTLKCPTCNSISVADSDAPTSQAIRDEIARQVEEGRSDAEIRQSIVDGFGKDLLLRPESTGVGALVWALPAVAAVLACAGLAFAFVRWRRRSSPLAPTDADRALVERALAPPAGRPDDGAPSAAGPPGASTAGGASATTGGDAPAAARRGASR